LVSWRLQATRIALTKGKKSVMNLSPAISDFFIE
jgi:hypothetical protein